MINNLRLWNSVEKTDTKYTKKVNQRGGYTAISPQYQLKLATDQFGPYGLGFGLKRSEFDYSLFESTGVVLHKATFFYTTDPGGTSEFVIHNAIQAKTKERLDVDFAKKLETNTVSKALSKLGFNADVYMGEFDDLDYFNERNIESQIEHAASKEEEKAKQAEKLKQELTNIIDKINSEDKVISVVEGLYKSAFRKFKDKPEFKGLLIELNEAKDKAKERLSND